MAHPPAALSFTRVIRVVIVVLATIGIAIAMLDTAIGWVIPFGLVGGVVVACILLALQSPEKHAAYSPDPFKGENLLAVINMSRLRVAGLGGAGLVFIAALVAFQFPLTALATVAGIAGGAVIALILIRRRRGHREVLTSPFDDGRPS